MIDWNLNAENRVSRICDADGQSGANRTAVRCGVSTSLHLNILSQVKFGLAPWQALETVTSTAAKAAKVDKDLGLLAPGYLADLILVEGDPLKNIKDVTKVQCVLKNDQIHSVGELMAPFVKSEVGVAMCPAR